MHRIAVFLGIPLAAVGLALAGIATATESTTLAQAGQPLTIVTGQGQGPIAEEDFIGDPALGGNTVRVTTGSTVIWKVMSDEIHTVTFPGDGPIPDVFIPQEDPSLPGMFNPQIVFPTVPDGPWDGRSFIHVELPTDGPQLAVTFARPGTYDFLCLFHVNMKGRVQVVPPGSAGITTQAALDAQATAIDAIRQTQAAEILAERGSATRIEGGRGTDLWFVRAGTDTRNGNLDIQAFLPGDLTISQGDTVVWYVDHLQPHTVTFRPTDGSSVDLFVLQFPDGTVLSPPAPGQPLPPEVLAAMHDPDSAPRVVFGPGAERTTNPIYDGRSLYSSGIIGEHPRITVPLDKVWALTFNTPGTFSYSCLLHEDLGMKGTITVQSR
ncbi:MAG TPA: hypothetical protein VFC51_13970 [Chloroflexota bacterium]|nr:hypothetical protein [Chloroflexota bacterium]